MELIPTHLNPVQLLAHYIYSLTNVHFIHINCVTRSYMFRASILAHLQGLSVLYYTFYINWYNCLNSKI
jgi:hypothetical protein